MASDCMKQILTSIGKYECKVYVCACISLGISWFMINDVSCKHCVYHLRHYQRIQCAYLSHGVWHTQIENNPLFVKIISTEI